MKQFSKIGAKHTQCNMFEAKELNRYSKQIQVEEIGLLGQLAIKQAKVAVVGAGGLGCPILQYLNAMGVGTIGIIDFDVIDETNLHRQVLYAADDIGKKKAFIAYEKLKQQNPYSHLIIHDLVLNELNAEEILSKYDFVIDGCDNFLTRYTVNDVCVKLNKPLVYGSILGFQGQVSTFNFQQSKNLRDLFPEPPNPEDVPNCSENGVLGVVPGLIGNIMAAECIQLILAKPQLINTLLLVDVYQFTMTKIQF